MSDEIELQKCSRTCMGMRVVDGHDNTIPCASAVSAPNCFCERHSNQRGMLTATSVAAFNDIVREGATGLCLVAVGPRAQPKGWNIPLPLARSVAAPRFYANIKQLPLSSMDSINRIDAAIDALQEDIKDHLKTALCSIADRTDNLKKRKEPPTVTQSEARKAIRDLVRLKRCGRRCCRHAHQTGDADITVLSNLPIAGW